MIRLSGGTVSTFQWSTSEQVWPFEKDHNGNPLYCRQIAVNYACPNSNYVNGAIVAAHGIANIDKPYSVKSWMTGDNTNFTVLNPTANGYGWGFVQAGYITGIIGLGFDKTNIRITIGENLNGYSVKPFAQVIYSKL